MQIINAAYKFKKHFTLIVNFPSKENNGFAYKDLKDSTIKPMNIFKT